MFLAIRLILLACLAATCLSDQPATAQQFWGVRAIDDAVMRRVDRDPDEPDGYEDTYYYITDHLRSVVAVLDHAGKLIERVRYGSYGEPTHHRPGDVNGDGVVDFFDAQTMIDLISGGPCCCDFV